MDEILVSVVVPCYQNGETVAKTIRSIQAQTERRWELICVDDGCTDNTGAVLDRLAAEEPRMRVIHQENAGVSMARNAGMLAARGKWIMFVDADDWLLFDALSHLLSLTDDATDIVCAAYERRSMESGETQVFTCRSGDEQAVIESLIRGDSALNSMCARLYRRSMLAEYQIAAPQGVRIGEDVLFNLDAFSAARGWRMSDEVIYVYEFGGDSAMMRARTGLFEKNMDMLNGIDRFLETHGMKTRFFRAHLDIYIRLLRADRGRRDAALSFSYAMFRRIRTGVSFFELDGKQRLYYAALRLMPALSYFMP